MAGKKEQKKQFWSDDEKRSICAQTTVSGVSVAQVARRFAMNANLIHNWLKDLRFAPEPETAEPDSHSGLIPVEIEGPVDPNYVKKADRFQYFCSNIRKQDTLAGDSHT